MLFVSCMHVLVEAGKFTVKSDNSDNLWTEVFKTAWFWHETTLQVWLKFNLYSKENFSQRTFKNKPPNYSCFYQFVFFQPFNINFHITRLYQLFKTLSQRKLVRSTLNLHRLTFQKHLETVIAAPRCCLFSPRGLIQCPHCSSLPTTRASVVPSLTPCLWVKARDQ